MGDPEDFGDKYYRTDVVLPVPPDDCDGNGNPKSLSTDAFLAIILGLIGIGGVVFTLHWITRCLMVLCAIGLTFYAARRHPSHPILRVIGAIVVIVLFVGLSSRPIWDDFHEKNPSLTVAWLEQWFSNPLPPPSRQQWVTEEEINAQRKLGRILLVLSPGEILSMYDRYDGNVAVAAYVDKWIKINYPAQASSKRTLNRKAYDVVSMEG